MSISSKRKKGPHYTNIIKKAPHCCEAFSAPQGGLFSNQFWDELRVYRNLNYLVIQVMNNLEVGLILVVLAIL
jgi:hypothetical protein